MKGMRVKLSDEGVTKASEEPVKLKRTMRSDTHRSISRRGFYFQLNAPSCPHHSFNPACPSPSLPEKSNGKRVVRPA